MFMTGPYQSYISPGWDIPREPGSQVPTKSSGSHEILAEIDAFLPQIWQEIQKYLDVKFMTKLRELQQKFCVSLKISWEPGSLAPGEYPTLPYSYLRLLVGICL